MFKMQDQISKINQMCELKMKIQTKKTIKKGYNHVNTISKFANQCSFHQSFFFFSSLFSNIIFVFLHTRMEKDFQTQLNEEWKNFTEINENVEKIEKLFHLMSHSVRKVVFILFFIQ